MNALVPAVAAALIIVGMLVPRACLRPPPDRLALPDRRALLRRRVTRKQLVMAGFGLAAGVIAWLVTGLAVALLVVPAAVLFVPMVLSPPAAATRIERLEALEEWTRSLSGVLGVGQGLEQAIPASLKSAPPPIRGEVSALAARLNARLGTRTAILAFADDIDDPMGDVIAMSLLLSVDRRGRGLSESLAALAESVAEDVAARRRVETDRAKPRTTVRLVTGITLAALAAMSLSGDYVEPYRSPLGSLILLSLLLAYAGVLLWLRQLSAGRPPARILRADRGVTT